MLLNKIEVRLAVYNIAVFAAVLIAFSSIIYFVVREGFENDMRSHLRNMTDGIISSIDFEHNRGKENPLPDMIVSELPSSASESLMNLRLQWFSKDGRLSIEKGTLQVDRPLNTAGGFEVQQNPKCMLFTKAVVVDNVLLGYARVGQPLARFDRAMEHIQAGLIIGVVASSIISGLGITLLISKSMQPLYANISRLKQFTADVSHELRTPVTAISTNSSVALKYADGMRETDREKFEMILSASKQLSRLVNDLLQIERVENPGADRESLPIVDVSKLVIEVRQVIAWLEQEKEIQLELELEPGLYIQAAEEDLFQILQNLLENALRYTPNGGRVNFAAFRDRTFVVLRVKDTGIGISSADLPRIFDRFWRADKARTHAGAGSGLGLSISKSIVTRLNGTIEAESTVDIGSIFTVRLQGKNQA